MSGSISAVVLNWNDFPATRRCVRSLQELSYPALRIVIVDNGSSDGSVSQLHGEFPDEKLVTNDENRGFSGGMNAGIKTALNSGAEYVWILNNDIIVPDEFPVERCVKRMEENPSIGALTPRITNYPDTEEAWFVQGLVNWDSGDSDHHKEVVVESRRRGDLVFNDFVPFSATLVRTELFEEVGYLPEEYFIYRDDVHYCLQSIKAGHDVVTDLSLDVHHEETRSTGGSRGPTIVYYTTRNRWVLRRAFAAETSLPAFLIDYIWWSAIQIGMIVQSRNLQSLRAWIRGTVDGIAGVRGKGPYP